LAAAQDGKSRDQSRLRALVRPEVACSARQEHYSKEASHHDADENHADTFGHVVADNAPAKKEPTGDPARNGSDN
jgi:hypothetical protein